MNRSRKIPIKKVSYYKGRDWFLDRKRGLDKRGYLLLFFPISLLLIFICRISSWIAENMFAKRIYFVLVSVYGTMTSIFPFSIAEFGFILGLLFCVFFFLRFLIRLIKGREQRKKIVGKFFLNFGCVVSVMFFLYTIFCGLNYYRYTFAYYSDLKLEKSDTNELFDLCISLVEQAKDIRYRLNDAMENEIFHIKDSNQKVSHDAMNAMNELAEDYPVLGKYQIRPKTVWQSRAMSYAEITGIYIPFTVEANVNVDVPDFEIPFTMCHELCHVRGFMKEGEANFIAYLACMKSNQLEFQYSGTMLALIYAGNQLYEDDPIRYNELIQTYSKEMLRDLEDDSRYWKRFENTIISKVSNRLNDHYLKVNLQENGSKSYGEMVDLLLALYKYNHNH